MFKQILITNGLPRCGKDTFAEILGEVVRVDKWSSIGDIKDIAVLFGYDDKRKDERDRQFLSALKSLSTEYSDYAFRKMAARIEKFHNPKYDIAKILIIDIREPEEIERAVNEFGAKTVLIENDRVEHITSNPSDARVFDYTYDYIVQNNGTLEEFRAQIMIFLAELIRDSVEG
jgi:hypothetical protein